MALGSKELGRTLPALIAGASTSSGGTGLQGIADRLAALDGSMEVRSTPGKGTTLAGSLPVDA